MKTTSAIKISMMALRCSCNILFAFWILFVFSGCASVERRIVYKPKPHTKKWIEPAPETLQGMRLEDVNFLSVDGTKLHGWYVEPADGTAQNIVLFAHGRRGNVSLFGEELFKFANRNHSAVFAFDYRGYGKSEGQPSENGIYQDTIAAREWLMARTQVSTSEVVLMGYSLGAAPVINVAARDGAKALIVESTFTSAPELLRDHSHGLLTGRRLQSSFNSIEKISQYTGPVFISHGKKDRTIPFDHGVRLASVASQNASSVMFVEFEGNHVSPHDEEYHERLSGFLNSLNTMAR